MIDNTETYVKFRGMKTAGKAVEIQLGDVQEFTGVAECVSVATERRADGEERPVIGMRVMEVELGVVKPAPKDEQLPFEEDDADAGDDEPVGDA